MAVALAATIGLAQMQVMSHRPETWAPARSVRLDPWPLSFKLPDILEWNKSLGDITDASDNEISFLGAKDGKHVCRVSFFVGRENPEFTDEITDKVSGESLVDRYEISIAGEDGMVLVLAPDTGSRSYAWCHAKQLDGTIISIFIETKQGFHFANRLAEWICDAAEIDNSRDP